MSTSTRPSSSAPLVSCIMPTADRRRFVPHAIEAFRRQDYPNRELLIIDDGTDAIGDLVPDDARIRYVRLPARRTVGAKRNRAVELARGDWIAHWDDDDWMAPERLRVQMDALAASERRVCGLDRLVFCKPEAQQAWLYRYPRNARPWAAGGTLLYHRDVWTRHPFEDVSDGEDTRFVWSLPGGSIHVLDALDLYVARVHRGNTSPKHTHTARWAAHPLADVRATLGDDWDAFAGVAAPSADASGDGVAAPTNARPDVRVRTDGDDPAGNAAAVLPDASATDPDATDPDADDPDAADASPRVTVTIPYYRCKTHIRRAVTSILGQTYPHLRLVVVNDGDPDPPWDVLDDVDDPRLVRVDLDTNRGRYFADAVVVQATPDPFYLVQDADDWSEPTRLAVLLDRVRESDALGAISAAQCWQTTPGGRRGPRRVRRLRYTALDRPLPNAFGFRADHHGLFRTDALRAVGGYYGGFRIGYDTLVVNLLMMLGSVAYVDETLYHRTLRPGSLTTSASTGMQSPRRAEVHTRLAALYRDAFARAEQARRGRPGPEGAGTGLADALARIATRHVTDATTRALSDAAERLRERFCTDAPPDPTESPAATASRTSLSRTSSSGASSSRTSLSQETSSNGALSYGTASGPGGGGHRGGGSVRRALHAVVHHPRLAWSRAWAPALETAHALADALAETRPQRILETGSGNTTVLFARYAQLTGAEVVSLEHHADYHRATHRLLRQLDLQDAVDLRHAPLRDASPHGRWYQTSLAGTFDYAFLDGPPRKHGRTATLPALRPVLAPGATVWLHDGARDHERGCVDAWTQAFGCTARLDAAGKGVWVLTDVAPTTPVA